MSLKDEMKEYKRRWEIVNAFIDEERRNAPIEQRWKQLKAIYALGVALGFPREDPTEMEVFERWAKLKEKLTEQPSKS